MDIIYIGSYCSEQYLNYLLKHNASPDFAGINLQTALLKGFILNHVSVESFTTPYSRSYPKCGLKKLKSDNYGSPGCLTHIIGYYNFPIIKLFSKYYNLKKGLRNVLVHQQNRPSLFIYSLQSPHLLAILANRKYFSKCCVMVSDLPQFMSGSKNVFYRVAKWLDAKIIRYCLNKIDCFVLLSDKMRELLPIGDRPHVVVEGIYSSSRYESDVARDSKNIIMYSGGISIRYNVFDLIEAFTKVSVPDVELWLCGSVDNQVLLNKYIQADKRIKYFGLLPTEEVRILQQRASLLINPRFGKEEFTKYSFPSKTLEYMASGTPTMMCHLPSLPKDYDKCLYFIEDEDVDGIKVAIELFFSTSVKTRLSVGTRARDFIIKYKSEMVQTSKILNLLKIK